MKTELSCYCCTAYEHCCLLDIEEHCRLKYFQPSEDFLKFIDDLVAPLTADGSSDEAQE